MSKLPISTVFVKIRETLSIETKVIKSKNMQNQTSLVGLMWGECESSGHRQKGANSAYERIFREGWDFLPASTGGHWHGHF